MTKPLSLYELNSLVRDVLADTLDGSYWVTAELSEVRVGTGGHCYLELVEKSARGGTLVAKARANIWRSTYALLGPHFERVAGRRLEAGMKVLVCVEVTFHELYGYALTVTDIDPTYTLGDMARRRQEILAQLEEEGVLTLNKELSLPRPLMRIAVISSPTAAGYGDFTRQLQQSGLPFRLELFEATMQGEAVERSVMAALGRIADEWEHWDAVVIIRGGGATSDLSGFESYELAAGVAQFPLPVLTGIGHERDDTVVDLVAHTRLRTPTAVAAFLIEKRRDELELMATLARRLRQAALDAVRAPQRQLQALAARFQLGATRYVAREQQRLVRSEQRAAHAAADRLAAETRRLETLRPRLQAAAARIAQREHHRLQLAGRTIALAAPERILRMGYSITRCEGRVLRSPEGLRAGCRIETQLADGLLASTVVTPTEA